VFIDDDLDALVARADLDGLVRLVDARCESRDWPGVLRIRDRSRAALESGRQLWPAATLAEYRLALRAPSEWATQVLHEDGGRFAIGPLTEVVAQNHSWSEMRDLLPRGPRRSFVAHERVLRGEVVDPDDLDDPVLDTPLRLLDWEPSYALPVYGDDGVRCDSPIDLRRPQWIDVGGSGDVEMLDDASLEAAARALVTPWLDSSNGTLRTAIVSGGNDRVVAALRLGSARLDPLAPAEALAWLAWCAASGGVHGRRRGAAVGRFDAWWFVAAVGGLDWSDLGSEPSAAVHDILESTTWWRLGTNEPDAPYQLSIVAEHDGETIAVVATDQRA